MSDSDDDRRRVEWDIAAAPRNYLALVGAQCVSFGSSFVLLGVLTRSVGTDGYGQIAAMVAASMLAVQLGFQWTAPAMARFASIEFVETGRIAQSFWARTLLLSMSTVVALSTMTLWLPLLCRVFHISAQSGLALCGYLYAQAWWLHLQAALLAVKLPRQQSVLLMIERVLCLGGVLLIRGHESPRAIVSVYALASLLMAVVGLVLVRRFIGAPRRNFVATRQVAAYSVPLIATTLIGYLSTSYLDTIFLVKYESMDEVGIYAAIAQVAGAFTQLSLLAGSLVLPALVSRAAVIDAVAAAVEFLNGLLPVLSFAWSAGCVALALLGPWLLQLLFGARFGDPTVLLGVLLVVAAISGPVLMGLLPIAHVLARPRILVVNALMTATFNVGLDALLIPRYGLLGCAWASAIAAAVSFAATWYLVADAAPTSRRSRTMVTTVPSVVFAVLTSVGRSAPFVALFTLSSLAVVAIILRSDLGAAWARVKATRAS